MNLRCISVVAASALMIAACGSSSSNAPSADTVVFQHAVSGTLAAPSFRFSVVTKVGSGPTQRAEGSDLAPDRSRLTTGGVERITVGLAGYFRGGGFGDTGWAKVTFRAGGELEYRALLFAVQDAGGVTRRGPVYSYDIARSGTSPALHWKLWVDASSRVTRLVYATGSGIRWDERFFDYGAAVAVDEPAAADTHPLTSTPPCPGNSGSSFDEFCAKV